MAVPCPAGKFSLEASLECTNCSAGRYGSAAAMASPDCTAPCQPGYYCEAGSSSAAQYPCASGYYCPAGSVNATAYQCAPGHYCSSGAMQSCAAGWFGLSSFSKTPQCDGQCPAGYYCPGLRRLPTLIVDLDLPMFTHIALLCTPCYTLLIPKNRGHIHSRSVRKRDCFLHIWLCKAH
jgi:hypothetical protein